MEEDLPTLDWNVSKYDTVSYTEEDVAWMEKNWVDDGSDAEDDDDVEGW